jgi:fumarate hydratase class II
MLVTALNRHIGYDHAAAIAKTALHEGSSLRDAALASGHVSAEQYERWVVPAAMTKPGDA